MIVQLLAFMFGGTLLYYFSPKVVKASSSLAKALEVDPLIIGLVIVGIGTSLPEIANSIISSVTGHGGINAGNAIGSGITQISLIFGLAIIIQGKVKGNKKKILFLGGCAMLAAILGVSMFQKGYLSRIDGLLLIISYLILLYFIRIVGRRKYFRPETEDGVYKTRIKEYAWKTAYSLAGIVVGAVIAVYMLIDLSRLLGISEFILSFLLMSINTSIPEFFIALSAIKEKEYAIAIGDIFGSNIADVTLSMGIGPLLVPNTFSSTTPLWSGLYLIAITGLITYLFSRKEKLERKDGVLMVVLYLLSFPMLLF